jgi:hypothetical protein
MTWQKAVSGDKSFQYDEEYRSNSYNLKTNVSFFGKKLIHYIIKQNCTGFKNKVAAHGSLNFERTLTFKSNKEGQLTPI